MLNDPDYYKQCHDMKFQVVLGDRWFGSVHTAVEIYKRQQRHFIGIVKTAHVGFPKQFIMDNLADRPAGTHLSLFTKYEGVYLIAMGYKYNKKRSCALLLLLDRDQSAT